MAEAPEHFLDGSKHNITHRERARPLIVVLALTKLISEKATVEKHCIGDLHCYFPIKKAAKQVGDEPLLYDTHKAAVSYTALVCAHEFGQARREITNPGT